MEPAEYLPRTYDYWFTNFVDPAFGDVWTTVLAATNRPPAEDLPKQWPWKNGYHSFEHALAGYITSRQLQGESVSFYYAHPPQDIRPYYYEGRIEQVDNVAPGIWRVSFRDVH